MSDRWDEERVADDAGARIAAEIKPVDLHRIDEFEKALGIGKNILGELSEEGQIRRVWDRDEVKSAMYRHAHYYTNNLREREIDELWVKKPENAATASYGRNWGYYVGMDEIKKYYLDNNPIGDGCMLFQPVSTDLIHVANDGKTARGMWYSMGHITVVEDGVTNAEWLFERVCADFVKEDDDWKIWHLFIGTDVAIEPGTMYNGQPVFPPKDFSIGEREFVRAGVGPTMPMMAYTPEFNWYKYPELPYAYDTFDPARGCGYEGNPAYKKEAE
jgi:hypothetical protein